MERARQRAEVRRAQHFSVQGGGVALHDFAN